MDIHELQIQRLKRHYLRSLTEYDQISLWELSHSLRIWVEMIENKAVESSRNFIVPVRTKGLKNILKKSSYIYSYLPGGIATSAMATKEIDSRSLIEGPHDEGSFSISTLVKIDKTNDITLAQFLLIHRALRDEEIKVLDYESKNVPTTRVAARNYINHNCLYYKFSDCDTYCISNSELIKRVANEYDGSHSSGTNFKITNLHSEPIRKIMSYKCASLPLPYFILLHIAHNILTVFE